MGKTKKREENKAKREKILDIKINKSALEKFMAKLFWYVLATITAFATILLIVSIKELVQAWTTISATLVTAWLVIKMPLLTLLVCLGWIGLIVVFVYLIKESK